MIFRTTFSAAALAAVTGTAIVGGAAQAQVMTGPTSKPYTIKLGAYLPSDDAQRSLSGDTHFDLGLLYEFGKTKTASPFVYGVYGDYVFQSSKDQGEISDDEGDTFRASGKSSGYDIGVQGRYFLGASGARAAVKPYAGLGLGFYSATSKLSADLGGGVSATDSQTKSGLGGKAMLGIEFKAGYLLEAAYSLLPGDAHFSGYGLNVGYRF